VRKTGPESSVARAGAVPVSVGWSSVLAAIFPSLAVSACRRRSRD